jgi:DNA-binding transcriptional ArsR family regulator
MPGISESDAVRIFRALGHPTRYRIVRILLERGEAACSELNETLPLSAPALSHHFKVLEECGLMEVRREGAYHFFRLNIPRLEQAVPGFSRVHSRLRR